MADGMWQRRRQRDQHRSRRPRRACFGELVQMDASIHSWLEGRGEQMVLVCMIDDATNRVMARFYPGETVEAYFDLVGRWLAKYGRPMAFYTDHDSVFEISSPGDQTKAMTQFGRAMSELGIELILAGSPRAKARVERSHGTMQDRWVELFRLAGITTLDAANDYVEKKLLPEHNRRFSHPAASPNDSHRPLGPRQNPAAILSIQESRIVANDYTIRFKNHVYQLDKPAYPGLRGGRVILEQRLDGTLAIRFRERYLEYKDMGALPPSPRSLPHQQHPAVVRDRAPEETRSPAVMPAGGCSGRTPAGPYPSADEKQGSKRAPYRPPTVHPRRRKLLRTDVHRTFLLRFDTPLFHGSGRTPGNCSRASSRPPSRNRLTDALAAGRDR